MREIALSQKLWKRFLIITMFAGLVAIAYTVGHSVEQPELPSEMLMPLLSTKVEESSTRTLIKNFTEARVLSEDFLLETEVFKLEKIEKGFIKRIHNINAELDRLSVIDDTGVEILVANLIRLKSDFERDVKTTFKLHRRSLGIKG